MIVGIDLGTTNSSVSVWHDDRSHLIPNALGHRLTPSVVALGQRDELLVGLAARERLSTHPGESAAAFKRYMGTDRITHLGGRAFRPEELSSLVLRSLKADAEAWLGSEVEEAVVTVPAYFSEAQRQATRVAGELAGLQVRRLLNEPTAAALAYGLQDAPPESTFLVFDLGGGTFDVSVLELFDGVMEVRASTGDNYLGGEDFVDALVTHFLMERAEQAGVSPEAPPPLLLSALRAQAERAKRALSQAERTTLSLAWQERELSLEITRERYEELCQPLLERLRAPIERALRDARLPASRLDDVLLVGGATRMPMVHKMVTRLFGRFPSSSIDPDEVVASGAGVQAGLVARDAALNDVVLTDVAPYTLGIAISRQFAGREQPGYLLPIIERNTVIPASRVHLVYPRHKNQTVVNVEVFQGEAPLVKDDIALGSFDLPLPRGAIEDKEIAVRFTYDVDGLLEVEATVVKTGDSRRIVIENKPGTLSRAAIERRLVELAKLKIHPRDQAENSALLARAGRLYEESLGEEREYVGELLAQFVAILDLQDPREVERARVELQQRFDELEGQTFL